MRAGLLSDARVVALLRTLFVPVHVSALNTPHCLHDPRDEALLRSFVGKDTDRFEGGEREAFVLPDGTMQRVFLSLNGHDVGAFGSTAHQYTAAGRRDDAATRLFRHHGGVALRSVHGELPEAWRALWDDDHPDVLAVRHEPARWPEPAAGTQAFRVFVRNSYRMYDDLHGCQLAALPAATAAALGIALAAPAGRAELPRVAFVALAQAMVPRGMVDTLLATDSITGTLTLTATSRDGALVHGVVAGDYALRPRDKAEVGKRLNAAVLFRSSGRIAGHFTWDGATQTFRTLRGVTHDVDFAWLPEGGGDRDDFAPRHQVAFEWLAGDPQVR